MSSDATRPSPEALRFDEPATGPAAPACDRCQKPIADAYYYEVNGQVVCRPCKTALAQPPAGNSASRMLRAMAFGIGGAVVGAGIYYAILALTGYEIGLVAIAVGWLVGLGVHKGSDGIGGWAYQVLAVGLTYLAIVSTYVPFILKAVGESQAAAAAVTPDSAAANQAALAAVTPDSTAGADTSAASFSVGTLALGLAALVAVAAAAPFLAGFENVIGIVIIGFALYQAWKMNRRVPLVIQGPFAVGRGPEAGGGE